MNFLISPVNGPLYFLKSELSGYLVFACMYWTTSRSVSVVRRLKNSSSRSKSIKTILLWSSKSPELILLQAINFGIIAVSLPFFQTSASLFTSSFFLEEAMEAFEKSSFVQGLSFSKLEDMFSTSTSDVDSVKESEENFQMLSHY